MLLLLAEKMLALKCCYFSDAIVFLFSKYWHWSVIAYFGENTSTEMSLLFLGENTGAEMLLLFWRKYWHWNVIVFLGENTGAEFFCFFGENTSTEMSLLFLGENTGAEMLLLFWRKYWHRNVARPTFGFPPIKFTSSRSLVGLILLRSRVREIETTSSYWSFFFLLVLRSG